MKNLLLLICFIAIALSVNAQTAIFHSDFHDCLMEVAIDEDNDVVWMGTSITDGGNLIRRDVDGNRTDLTDLTQEIDLESVSCLFMEEDVLFAGGLNGVAIVDTENSEYVQYTDDDGLSNSSQIITMAFDYNSDKLYVGNIITKTDILSESGWDSDNTLNGVTSSFFDYEDDVLWLANTSGDVYKIIDEEKITYNQSNSEVPKLVYVDMSGDDNGNIYLLVSGGSMLHFDGENATHYTTANSDIFGGTIKTIQVDLFGVVWLGHNGGLTSFDGTTFTTYALENYLDFYATVEDIVVDNKNHLWLATCGGLVEFYTDEVLDVNDEHLSSPIIYPNPSQGETFLDAKNSGVLNIFDNSGRLVYNATVEQGRHAIPLMDNGLFTYSFITKSETFNGKLVVTK